MVRDLEVSLIAHSCAENTSNQMSLSWAGSGEGGGSLNAFCFGHPKMKRSDGSFKKRREEKEIVIVW